MFHSEQNRVFEEDKYGAHSLIGDKGDILEIELVKLNSCLSSLIGEIINYRNTFIENYNKSIKQTVYKNV